MAGILPPLSAYSFRHLHSPPLHRTFRHDFAATGTLPYHETLGSIRGFGDELSPDHFRRRPTRLVSYYALFKGMAASKPTSQLSERIHILSCPLSPYSGTLADGLGSYPLAYADYPTHTVSQDPSTGHSEFAWSR